MTEQQLAQLTAAILELHNKLNTLTVSIDVLKCCMAIRAVGSGHDEVVSFLEQIRQVEQACSPGPEEQKALAAVVQALKRWIPKQSSDS